MSQYMLMFIDDGFHVNTFPLRRRLMQDFRQQLAVFRRENPRGVLEAPARREHPEIVEEMKSAGVDFIVFESMNTIREARAAAEAAHAAGLPVWVSFVMRENAKLLGGEPVADAARALEGLGVDVVLVNCAPIEDITAALGKLRKARSGPVGAYAHIGRYDPPSWKFGFYPRFSGTEAVTPEKYLEAALEWKKTGAQVIGGCCGTAPEHIRLLGEKL